MNPIKAFVGTLKTVDNDVVSKPSVPLYNIEINALNGKAIDLSEFKGKKILFVNVASKCGFTPQYTELQKLSDTFKNELVVIGVPCNQFGSQEPGDAEEIQEFCEVNFGVSFLITEKIDVKGPDQHPLYQWLTKKYLNGKQNSSVKWNFQKYLIDENGEFLDYFYSITKPFNNRITKYLN
ncbi:glutathione peroxidase [Winogradskyella alexanderae]|uniref:Glutathione peroxidase n=1 Tax=Winogradskyella alexanderae TaxID=2877123 RepID=A0ABS7XPE3_9FLAO|nr:glutathione peroxidase [Winogradskyella alexanderae]MCA0131885.1 glutathione peroxidase [Winogradskyella alexanderae]